MTLEVTSPSWFAATSSVQYRQLLVRTQDACEEIASLSETRHQRTEGKAVRREARVFEFVPVNRCRDGRPSSGAGTVRGDEGFVDGVLGVVEPSQAATVMDLPFPAHELRYDGTDGLRQLFDPGPGLVEGWPRCDRDPNLYPTLARDLGAGSNTKVVECGAV